MAIRHTTAIARFVLVLSLLSTASVIPGVFGETSATNYPLVVANDSTVGDTAWDTPQEANVSDDSYANAVPIAMTYYLKATNFSFGIPSPSHITGIVAEIERTTQDSDAWVDAEVRLVNEGSIGTQNKANSSHWGTDEPTVSYGGSNDTWGESWDVSSINDNRTGLVIAVETTEIGLPNKGSNVDMMRLTVYYNAIPTITDAILNSTWGNNSLEENLTLHFTPSNPDDGLSKIRYAYDWRLDGTSIALLNLPFDVNDSAGTNKTLDISTATNNGTLMNGSQWISNIGYNGSPALNFTGAHLWVNLSSPVSIDGPFTVMFWADIPAIGPKDDIMTVLGANPENHASGIKIGFRNSTGDFTFYARIVNASGTIIDERVTTHGSMHHFALRRDDADDVQVYVDGSPLVIDPTTVSGEFRIDYLAGSDPYTDFEMLHGTIDNVKIFNRSLTDEQIALEFNNRSHMLHNTSLSTGEQWQACVIASDAENTSELTCSNTLEIGCPLTNITTPTTWTTNQTLCDLYVMNGTYLTFSGNISLSARNVYVLQNSTINHTSLTRINITASGNSTNGNIYVEQNSTINATGKGHPGGAAESAGGGGSCAGVAGSSGSNRAGSGGSNGGNGGEGYNNDPTVTNCGNLTDPNDYGGGGGGANGVGGAGGGLIVLNATGIVTIDGLIIANGRNGTNNVFRGSGGGAGGNVFIRAATITGSGSINATGGNGGEGDTRNGGGGGGGRISLHYGTLGSSLSFDARGGLRPNGDSASDAGGGTIYLRDTGTSTDELRVDNGGRASTGYTNLTGATSPNTFSTVNLTSNAFFGDAIQANTYTFFSGDLYFHNQLTGTSNITVMQGAKVTTYANSNALVYLLNLTGANMLLLPDSVLNTTGNGYPAGSGSGTGVGPGNGSFQNGAGGGGASHGGQGGNGKDSTTNGGDVAYGNITHPLTMGSSGGSTSVPGGPGGGVILINLTGTLWVNGTIEANGRNGTTNPSFGEASGGGAGGSVQIHTGTFNGNGTIRANGGKAGDDADDGGSGGGGRIAVHYATNAFAGSLSARGGELYENSQAGGAGTIYFKDRTLGKDLLSISNGELDPEATQYTNVSSSTGPTTYSHLNLTNATVRGNALIITDTIGINPGSVMLDSAILGTSNLTVLAGGSLAHTNNSNAETYSLNLTVQNVVVQSGGAINATSRGYSGGSSSGNGNGPGNGTFAGGTGGGGASHAGLGGNGQSSSTNGGDAIYGSVISAYTSGSGGAGGGSTVGTAGGGRVFINATDTINVTGQILAGAFNGTSGLQYSGGAGAGGSIWIITDTLTGAGTISAVGGAGGDGTTYDGGSGSGGRLSLNYRTFGFTGVLNVSGGRAVGSGDAGQVGTIFRCIWSAGGVSCPGNNGTVVLTTAYSNESAMNITRNLTGGTWNGTLVRWNETTTSDDLLANYTLTGLNANHIIKTFVNGSFNNTGFTDSSGNLPVRVLNASASHEYLFIGNDSTPSFTMTWNGSLPGDPLVYKGEDILCKVTPIDTDDFNATVYWWIINDTTTYNSSTIVVNLSAETLLTTVDGDITNGLENWTCRIIVGDGALNATQQQLSVNIEPNALAVMDNVTITPDPAYTDDDLLGWCNATDADNSVLSYHYVWYRNGTEYSIGYANNGGVNYTQGLLVNVASISASLTTKHDNWTLQCRAFDGTANSSWMNSSTASIQNTIPTITAFVVNSTYGGNTTGQDLTAHASVSDTDGDYTPVTYDWRVNGTSIALLRMSFDANDSAGTDAVRDLSTYGHNGTLGTDGARPTWNATGGWNGTGAYRFNGSSYIDIPASDAFDVQRPTISAWVYSDSFARNMHIFEKGSVNTQYSLFFEGTLITFRSDNTVNTQDDLDVTHALTGNMWHHVVATYNGTHKAIYLDGNLAGSRAYTQTLRTGLGTAQRIGAYGGATPSYFFNGTIDDLTVYNRSLTSTEITYLYRNRTDSIAYQELVAGENWTACATPSDGDSNGTTVCSTGLLINENTLPSVSSITINSTFGTNFTSENLTAYASTTDDDGEPSTHGAYDWRRNGTSIATASYDFDFFDSGGTGATRDESSHSHNGTVTGSFWSETGGRNGTGAFNFGASAGHYISIPYTALNGSTDSTYSFWVKSSATSNRWLLSGANSGNDNELLIGFSSATVLRFYDGQGSTSYVDFTVTSIADNAWHHVVVIRDDTNDEVRLYIDGVADNENPEARTMAALTIDAGGLLLGQEQDSVGGGLSATQAWSGLMDDVQIYNRSLSEEQILALYNNRTDLIVAEETEVDENWTACVTPNDGFDLGAQACSAGLLITAPSVTTIEAIITPEPAYTSDDLLGWCNGTNEASTNISYHWEWYKNGELNRSGYADNNGENYTQGILVNVINLSASNTTKYDNWTITCYARYATTNGTGISDSINISNTPPEITTLIVNSTTGTNLTSENLTAYASITDADEDITRSAIDWRRNGTSITMLNMDFDTNNSNGTGSTRDYSSYGNNASVNGAVWNATGGWNGTGAYEFTNDYLDLQNTIALPGNFTIMFWENLDAGLGNDDAVVGQAATNSINHFGGLIRIYSGSDRLVSSTATPTDTWVHYTFTRNGSSLRIYTNGTLTDSNTGGAGWTFSIDFIGNGPAGAIDGTIDDVRIYNYTLSAEQITAIYANRTDLIVAEETEVDENWTACVTPNDGFDLGAQACSAGLLITAPSVTTIEAIITPEPAYTSDDLLGWCNGTNEASTNISYHWEWYKNDELNLSGYADNNGENYTQGILVNVVNLSASNTTKDDNWTLTCYARYVTTNGTGISDSINISNTPPEITALIVNSTTGTNLTSENLTAYASITDADEDITRSAIDWRRNGTSIAAAYYSFDVNNSNSTGSSNDHSSHNNNITIVGATWSATSGVNGSGAYSFDGTGDYLTTTDTTGLPTGNVAKSITAWFTQPSCGLNEILGGFGAAAVQQNFQIDVCDTDQIRIMGWGAGNDWSTGISEALYNDGAWHFVAVTYNGSNTSVYLDGALQASTTGYTFNTGTTRIAIGDEIDLAGRPYSGEIDEFRIWNRSLSGAQILALYNNRTDLIVSDETEVGENWTACVTPNDGTADGSTSCTDGLLITEVTDSCTPPSVDNNWLVYASDNCTKTLTSIDLGLGNLTVTGETGPGYLKLNTSNLTANNVWVRGEGNLTRIILENSAKVVIS